MEVIPEHRLVRWYRTFKKTLRYFMLGSAILAGALTLFLLYLRSKPLPPVSISETTTMYGDNGQVIATLYKGENRTFIPLDKIPSYMRDATVAIEDRKFYNHTGFDIKRIAGAALTDIRHLSKVEGASTITMQLARNLYLSHDKTWSRKLREAILTMQLELNYTKPQLLELYMNQIYYGQGAYGIQAAAKTYFGKNAGELTLAEASMLAGLPKGPRFYSPFVDMKAARERQDMVLSAMVTAKFITAQQAADARNAPIKLAPLQNRDSVISPYFRDFVVQQLKDTYHIDPDLIEHGGLKIYTTLDPAMQKQAEAAVAKYLPANRTLQAALVAMEPQTGYIRAMVGGRSYKESSYNRTLAERQPGSSIKPILYMAALENGFTPLTRIKSQPTVFTYGKNKKEVYAPKNFGSQYAHDFINMDQAIARSDNIYAVQTDLTIGQDKMVSMAKRLGIVSPVKPIPSSALGSSPATAIEMARAFSTLANQGKKADTIAVTKIVDREGNTILENHPRLQQVVSPENAFILTNLMKGVFDNGGTAHRVANMIQRPVAGKTGTTDYDAWLTGFTPDLTASVWVGYDDNRKIDEFDDARQAAPIWAQFMNGALQGKPAMDFTVPPGVVSAYVDPESGQLATEACPDVKLMYFIPGTQPTEYCVIHRRNNVTPPPTTEKKSFWDRLKFW
ncbi:PBP1A family penicillin-binding protein [Aneurinibacillus sp. Ricciae_BoGa-3]|uniref:transglycosylase domain-containing protein n=1 Tax=Aneurinibacillus sp. Ricciae_BoGa-3 TaxID=3022697 RepID=UPI0023420DBB|nr:PBP1A family penicillin-binding protein [Aneurinibacillus sp. Ricciae_BoGa-3]WCK54388.1 PBP1A family penicillin-binding protein [Aneurinibacillus sp. Ricciae_BoGa-3]